MTLDQFFNLFLQELEGDDSFRPYYKYHDEPKKLLFRKAYFCQRLSYIYDAICNQQQKVGSQELKIWDAGSGYSTTQIFLALNGIKSHGSTLEFYYEHLNKRMGYWSMYGDMGHLSVDYENIFESNVTDDSQDVIIVQDTLHHLEPMQESMDLLSAKLRKGGIMIVVEENGSNIIQRAKLYKQRGSNRVIEYHDERLNKTLLMGNENIRSLATWEKAMAKSSIELDHSSVEYVRVLPAGFYKNKSESEVVAREQRWISRSRLVRKYFAFGINFVGVKK